MLSLKPSAIARAPAAPIALLSKLKNNASQLFTADGKASKRKAYIKVRTAVLFFRLSPSEIAPVSPIRLLSKLGSKQVSNKRANFANLHSCKQISIKSASLQSIN